MRVLTLACVLVPVVTSGCLALDGSGVLAQETRSVIPFEAVCTRSGIDVEFTVDDTVTGDVELTVAADDNLLEHITTRVSSYVLSVSAERSFTTRLDPVVTARVPPLVSMESRDGSSADIDGIDADIFDIIVADGGLATPVGTAEHLDVRVRSGSRLTAAALEATTAEVRVVDGSSAVLCVTDSVTGTVSSGSSLTMVCGGDSSGVTVEDGGVIVE